MQFGRRCAACDAFYLAAVQMARGRLSTTSTWGRMLNSSLATTQNKWIETVRERLSQMQMLDEVLDRPASFLENRKTVAVHFAQWCHHNHHRFANGSSADLFRVSRPFGALPALMDVPTPCGRKILLMLLSCWRWGLTGADEYPEYCALCDCLNTSHHLLFRCIHTEDIRQIFARDVGLELDEETIYSDGVSWALARVFASICYRIEQRAGVDEQL
jgi:hypothetical protein